MARKSVATRAAQARRGTAGAKAPGAAAEAQATALQAASAPGNDADNAGSLIKAGLKALGQVRGDIVARQARIFELLLGIGQSPAWVSQSKTDSVDPYSKFEDVFDQRVARSLERLGMPSPQELRDLTTRIKELTELLQAGRPESRRRR